MWFSVSESHFDWLSKRLIGKENFEKYSVKIYFLIFENYKKMYIVEEKGIIDYKNSTYSL